MTSLLSPLALLLLSSTFFLFGLFTYLAFKVYGSRVRNELLADQLIESRHALGLSQEENSRFREQASRLEVEKERLHQQLMSQEKLSEEHQRTLLLQFENLSTKILDQKSEKFTNLNKTELDKILKPLSEKIHTFEKEVARTHREALNHKVALRTELERMHTLNSKMSQEAKNLTEAIKGDSRTQGAWGEFILENLLESAGLVKGREYIVQHSFVDEEGKRHQPDVIINLPQGKSVVIDAKMSLKDYEQYYHAKEGSLRDLSLKKHLASLKRHIKVLHNKNYAETYDLKSLDFVLMFIPLEPAFSLALQADPNLFQQAYHENVILASPSTLLAILRTIVHVWKREYQNQYATEIAQQSGALYDKFAGFVEDMRKIGTQLTSTQKVYQSAIGKLSEGKGNLISKAERIRSLGARTKKEVVLPPPSSNHE